MTVLSHSSNFVPGSIGRLGALQSCCRVIGTELICTTYRTTQINATAHQLLCLWGCNAAQSAMCICAIRVRVACKDTPRTVLVQRYGHALIDVSVHLHRFHQTVPVRRTMYTHMQHSSLLVTACSSVG